MGKSHALRRGGNGAPGRLYAFPLWRHHNTAASWSKNKKEIGGERFAGQADEGEIYSRPVTGLADKIKNENRSDVRELHRRCDDCSGKSWA